MGTPITGNGGLVKYGSTTIGDVLDWSLDDMAELHPYRSNSTAGARKRINGGSDWNATINMLLDTAAAIPLAPGDSVTIHLFVNATKEYSGAAMVERVATTVNIDSGAPIGQVATVQGNGALTRPTFP